MLPLCCLTLPQVTLLDETMAAFRRDMERDVAFERMQVSTCCNHLRAATSF